MAADPVDRYLARYAEKEAHDAAKLRIDRHDRCIVIPAFQESLADIESVTEVIDEDCLLIIVINAPQADASTRQLLADITSRDILASRHGNLDYLTADDRRDTLVVDRCSRDFIPPRQGVGLARKIGADIALSLMAADRLKPGLIHMTDADAVLPPDYFHITADDAAAVIYPFRHDPGEPSAALAGQLYELSLLYYVLGLRWSGSHYAWPTIGSTLAVNYRHYAMVRGFPRRNAAEDFYLLNKIAKTGPISLLAEPVITLSARPSTRVPFGTGPAVRQISAMEDALHDYHFYDPEVFSRLRSLLQRLDEAWTGFTTEGLPASTVDAVGQLGLEAFLETARRRSSRRPVFDKAVRDWFDGFRTLKFIHFLRDHELPSVPLAQVVGSELVPDSLDTLPALRDRLAARCFDPTC